MERPQKPDPNGKIWICECKTCGKITDKRCNICKSEFYCSGVCTKSDYKHHKKTCIEKAKFKAQWEKKKVLDLEKDIFLVASEVFDEKYTSEDKKFGTFAILPIRMENLEGRKTITVAIFGPEDPPKVRQSYIQKGYTADDYYQVHSLGKASLFHSALVLAVKELSLGNNLDIVFNDEPVLFYGEANVKVVLPHAPIDLVYTTVDKPDTIRKEHLNIKEHNVFMFKTKSFDRVLVDFTSAQYGIFEKNLRGTDRPVFICTEEGAKEIYEFQHLILSADIEDCLNKDLKTAIERKDFFPISLLSYKNALVGRIRQKKAFMVHEQFYPSKARFVDFSVGQDAIEEADY